MNSNFNCGSLDWILRLIDSYMLSTSVFMVVSVENCTAVCCLVNTVFMLVQLDLEFETLIPDCPDFLQAFPAVIEKLMKHSQLSSMPVIREVVQAAGCVDIGKILY